ncbi:MAG TPA: RecQ family ATP-dependent DNA helicase, partial [Myxococcota bacterium]|nr:RecQ family ATP-dependent DNA helicase [Myxococcota bacterium]
AGLRRLGYPAFRPGQREAVETLLAQHRLLLIAPTGGGKSLTYQLPASLLPGTSLVVSPLISLMHDQVAALQARGVPATFLASTLDAGEMRRRMARVAQGAFRLVYVAPERLTFPGFRAGQREAVETLLAERRLLLVAPTGGGKSLVYQLPAVLLPGTALVVSPLISLMHDQVAALEARGVRATFLASTLEPRELRRRMADAAAGRFELVYAAPERLLASGVHGLVRALRCPLLAIDEAHCISEWGHDFRPEYLALGDLVKELPEARVLACTATATPVVRDEILARLGLDPATPQIVRGFARPNLALRAREVAGARERERAVDALLAEALGEPGAPRGAAIVYTPTRRAAEGEAERLARRGWRADAYHAGLDAAVRDEVSRRFAARAVDVVVATNAFGMGIDRPDVRAVAHLAPPGSIEAYYQEVGRAGRDGADAIGLLLVSPGDLAQRRALLERDAADPELRRHRWSLFLELLRYAEGGSCRHDAILRYFGDEAEALAGCGRCDACERLADPGGADEAETTLIVRKALSAVARIHGRFGLGAAAKLLRGEPDARLAGAGLDRTPTFGALRDRGEAWLLRLLRRCVSAGLVDLSGGERPVALLTAAGGAVMRAERPPRLLLPPLAEEGADGRGGARRARGGASAGRAGEAALDGADAALFEALRRHRLEVARAEGVPPYAVATDRALRDVAALRPATLADLELAHGIGPAKAKRYGPGLLEVVRRAAPAPAAPPSGAPERR